MRALSLPCFIALSFVCLTLVKANDTRPIIGSPNTQHFDDNAYRHDGERAIHLRYEMLSLKILHILC